MHPPPFSLKRLAPSAAAALAALACVGATVLVWPRSPAPLSAPVAVATSDAAPAGASGLADLHLFGIPPDPGTPSAPPPPPLALTLTGVLHAQDGARARALIAGADGAQRSYAAGAALPGGARLVSVHADAVTVSHGAGEHELVLPELVSRGTPQARPAAVNARLLAARRQALARRAAASGSPAD